MHDAIPAGGRCRGDDGRSCIGTPLGFFDFCAEKAELRVPLGLMQNGSYVDQPKLSLSVSHGFYTQTVRLVETFTLDMRHKSSSSWCSTSVLRVAGTPVSASASAAATSRV